MPEWAISIGVAMIGALAGGLTAWAAFAKSSRDDRQLFVDQIQEERNAAVTQAKDDREAFTAQIDRLWRDKAASRDHVNALKDHIWQRKPPPPPDAPEGYIP